MVLLRVGLGAAHQVGTSPDKTGTSHTTKDTTQISMPQMNAASTACNLAPAYSQSLMSYSLACNEHQPRSMVPQETLHWDAETHIAAGPTPNRDGKRSWDLPDLLKYSAYQPPYNDTQHLIDAGSQAGLTFTPGIAGISAYYIHGAGLTTCQVPTGPDSQGLAYQDGTAYTHTQAQKHTHTRT